MGHESAAVAVVFPRACEAAPSVAVVVLNRGLGGEGETVTLLVQRDAGGDVFTAGPLVSQLRAAGVTVPVIGQEGYDSQKFIEIAGPASEGIIITTSLARDSSAKETMDFIAAFASKGDRKVDMVAASAHTAITVMVEAMRKAGTKDRKALRDAIAATKLTASTGAISFNQLGEVRKDVQVQIVKDGNWRFYSVISDPDLLAPPTL